MGLFDGPAAGVVVGEGVVVDVDMGGDIDAFGGTALGRFTTLGGFGRDFIVGGAGAAIYINIRTVATVATVAMAAMAETQDENLGVRASSAHSKNFSQGKKRGCVIQFKKGEIREFHNSIIQKLGMDDSHFRAVHTQCVYVAARAIKVRATSNLIHKTRAA